MTIEIEAGASQPQCSMKKLTPTIIFRGCFRDQFVLNITSRRAMMRTSPAKMRVRCGNLFLNRFCRITRLAYL